MCRHYCDSCVDPSHHLSLHPPTLKHSALWFTLPVCWGLPYVGCGSGLCCSFVYEKFTALVFAVVYLTLSEVTGLRGGLCSVTRERCFHLCFHMSNLTYVLMFSLCVEPYSVYTVFLFGKETERKTFYIYTFSRNFYPKHPKWLIVTLTDISLLRDRLI